MPFCEDCQEKVKIAYMYKGKVLCEEHVHLMKQKALKEAVAEGDLVKIYKI